MIVAMRWVKKRTTASSAELGDHMWHEGNDTEKNSMAMTRQAQGRHDGGGGGDGGVGSGAGAVSGSLYDADIYPQLPILHPMPQVIDLSYVSMTVCHHPTPPPHTNGGCFS